MKQFWIINRTQDLTWIILPGILPLFLLLFFPSYFQQQKEVNLIWWLVLVVFVDVAHVYSTLFRFVWEKETRQRYKQHLVLIPIACFAFGLVLFQFDTFIFWRVMAYIAVFHFVRQQYGIYRLYARNEKQNSTTINTIENAAIYATTLYPLVYWHVYKTQSLQWFVAHDFVTLPLWVELAARYVYGIIILLYILIQIHAYQKNKLFNLPKHLFLIASAISWYVGIVLLDGDLLFTLFNVLAHGIPYMALVYHTSTTRKTTLTNKQYAVGIFMISIICLAYVEEGLWDWFVWQEHGAVFFQHANGYLNTSDALLSFLVPLLVVPQLTHYILDGFIWRKQR
ncbi:MAG: hypothetical protein MUF68_02160 [Cyclobacteriaceae bacterium]|jgi:hypothetical protein|nr:hypothetical protein [Cyclobacteriaceae bacterium]